MIEHASVREGVHPGVSTVFDATATRLLGGANMAHLASLRPDGGPHAVPVWIDAEGDKVAVLTDPVSVKAHNLRRDPRVAISMTEDGNSYVTVVLRGRVTAWLEGDPPGRSPTGSR
jgi:PPOX class probable F420-dependent enzyme